MPLPLSYQLFKYNRLSNGQKISYRFRVVYFGRQMRQKT